MKITTTRFIISVLATLILGGMGFYAISKGDSVTSSLIIPTIGGIVGYYTYGKTKNNDTYMETQKQIEEKTIKI